MYYIRGSYTTDNGYTYTPNHGNKLEDRGNGNFYVNGEPWGTGITADLEAYIDNRPVTFYFDETISSNLPQESNGSFTITGGEFGQERTTTYYEGYSYMKNAYYARIGMYGTLKKYAEFTWAGTIQPDGNPGIDYIQGSHSTTDQNGEPMVEYGYYKIEHIQDDPVEGAFEINEIITSSSNSVWVEIYPYSFTNPYETAFTGSAQDSNYYTITATDSSISITQNATYYYYDGGYEMFETEFDGETVKGIYNQILDETYNDLFKVGYKLTFYNSNGGVREINNLTDFKNFLNSSNSSNYYIDDPTDYEPSTLVTDEYQYRVDYNYKVKNNTLYALSSSYSLQNGVLAVGSLVSNEIDEMYNLNKFLTNNEIQLFTRYKYLTDDSQTIDNILQSELFDGHTFPTSTIGGAYYFIESVSISIGGGTVYLTFVDGLDDEGNPNNEMRDEINTGGIVVLD